MIRVWGQVQVQVQVAVVYCMPRVQSLWYVVLLAATNPRLQGVLQRLRRGEQAAARAWPATSALVSTWRQQDCVRF